MFDLDLLQSWFISLLPWMVGLGVLALLDALLGAAEAWYYGDFKWEYFPEFFKTLLVYFLAWITSEVLSILPVFLSIQIGGFGEALADYGPKMVFAFIAVSKYTASIVKHIQTIKDIANPEPKVV